MSSPSAEPKYYTPTYGLPEYHQSSDTDRFADRGTWRAPGVGAGRLQWEPLHGRSTPYPWEHQRPPEAWERSTRTVDEGPLPARPEPLRAPEPAAPLPPVQVGAGQPASPARTVPHGPGQPGRPTADPGRDAGPPTAPQQAGTKRRRPPAPSGSPQVHAAPSGPVAGYTQPADAGLDVPSFPPPTGQPITPPRGQPLRPRPMPPPPDREKKQGGMPFVSLLLVLLVFIEPGAVLLPLIAGLVLIVTSGTYRNPAARVGWGVFVMIMAVVASLIRFAMF